MYQNHRCSCDEQFRDGIPDEGHYLLTDPLLETEVGRGER